ncbi:bifunctional diguanylate cyclase/phosphodiesterase [Quadrisphaera sp. DSM 44207]|uniref:putative bifunctional diguanylate cyclase/phosphodiesterase n=1 Tax=Quadrisphaera sp. DSM 44207 TaxID=1881057 RepID=UPI00115FE57E|nr:bifunctional diguanylate cyclase/phosphodiesterase [Quadrisphaera sp. DSM 44207]
MTSSAAPSPAARPRPRGGRWNRPPAISSLPAAWRLLAALYSAVGLLVLATTLLPAASGARLSWAVQLLDGVAVAAAVVMALLARRLPRRLLNPTIAFSTVLITAAVLASGGGSTAVAYACAYLAGPIFCRFVVQGRDANVQLALTVVQGVLALSLVPDVGFGEQVVLWGVLVILCAAVDRLIGALEEAESDALTGLPNRRGVERVLREALAAAGPSDSVALVLLELDHFRAVNENLGRGGGDRLLVVAAETWRPLVPEGHVLGRFSGDGFAVVMPGAGVAAGTALAERLRTALPREFSCSAGSVGWEPGESASMLVSRADAAVYAAKREGRGRTHQHPGTGSSARAIREAVGRGEFVVHLQPIADLRDGSVAGAEALVRWQHPERGLLPPAAFVPEAERTGAIVELGGWVLQEACRQAATWPAVPGRGPAYLSVNASGRELQQPDYSARVERALRSSGLPPGRLLLELVESHYDNASVHLGANLHHLRTLGVTTAVDDFGVGYSSLDRLRRLGVDVLKIDRSFVADITCADQEAPLVLAMVAMADALGLRVVAEGVETFEQARWLVRHGCCYGQGALLGGAAAGQPPTATGVVAGPVPPPRARDRGFGTVIGP